MNSISETKISMQEFAPATVRTVDRLTSGEGFISYEGFFSAHNIENVKVHMCQFSPDSYNDSLFNEYGIELPEKISVAVTKRRMEFLAGRYSASRALMELSAGKVQVGIGPAQLPIFPAPIIGSISHSRNTACCVATRSIEIKGLGVDVEYIIDSAQMMEIGDCVISNDEANLLINSSFAYTQLFTAVFSAKESLFKALYPRVGYYFGFEYASLRHLEADNNTLVFELTKTLTDRYSKGKIFFIKYYIIGNKVLTLVTI